MILLPEYHQGAPEWGDLTLAPSALTIRSHGCFSVAVCAALHAFQVNWTPREFRDRAVEHHGYDADGLLVWDAIRRMTGDRVFWHERVYTSNDPRNNGLEMKANVALAKVCRYIDLGMPVILCVDAVGNDGYPDHAVVTEDYRLSPSIDFRIMDPARGRKFMFSEVYGDPRKKVYGYVSFIGPATMYPDGSPHKGEGSVLWKQKCIELGINVPTYARETVDTMLSPTITIA